MLYRLAQTTQLGVPSVVGRTCLVFLMKNGGEKHGGEGCPPSWWSRKERNEEEQRKTLGDFEFPCDTYTGIPSGESLAGPKKGDSWVGLNIPFGPSDTSCFPNLTGR